jgi:Nucleotidyltransferase of unknown function (DUF6036)
MRHSEPKLTLPEQWRAFLADVDRALEQPLALQCLGGFVLAALYARPRPTNDVDYIEITPRDRELNLLAIAGQNSKLARRHKLYIQRTTIAAYPDGYESRMQRLALELRRLEVFTLGPYDLALSKICSDRTKDEEDAKYVIQNAGLQWKTFLQIWESEMKYQVAPRHGTSIALAREYFTK